LERRSGVGRTWSGKREGRVAKIIQLELTTN